MTSSSEARPTNIGRIWRDRLRPENQSVQIHAGIVKSRERMEKQTCYYVIFWSKLHLLNKAVCANGFPIHARCRRFSPGSLVSSCLQNCMFVCYVDVGTPLEISLKDLQGYTCCMPK